MYILKSWWGQQQFYNGLAMGSKSKEKNKKQLRNNISEHANIRDKKESHRVYAHDLIEGQVQPAELRRLSQEVVQGMLEAGEVSDAVVAQAQRTAQVLPLRVSLIRPHAALGDLWQRTCTTWSSYSNKSSAGNCFCRYLHSAHFPAEKWGSTWAIIPFITLRDTWNQGWTHGWWVSLTRYAHGLKKKTLPQCQNPEHKCEHS